MICNKLLQEDDSYGVCIYLFVDAGIILFCNTSFSIRNAYILNAKYKLGKYNGEDFLMAVKKGEIGFENERRTGMQTVKMTNGVEISVLGFGVFRVEDEDSRIQSIHDVVEAGFRQINTAAVYRNEIIGGRGVVFAGAWGVPNKQSSVRSALGA